MRSFASSWNVLWFAGVPPDIFAVLRVLFGLLGLVSLAGMFDLPTYWSCDGLVSSADSAVCARFQSWGLGWVPGYAVLTFATISFAGMTIGYQSRVSTLCAFASITVIALWNNLPLSAAHQVLRSLLFCLIWADCGQRWSLDAWHRRRRGAPGDARPEVPIWPLRLIRIQVAAIYFVTGLWKLNNVIWRDGSALHYVFENPQFRRFDFLASPALDPWSTLGTYVTLLWELGFAFLVVQPRLRAWVLTTGVALHLGMWATLELGPFSWIMLASYVAFLDPAAVRSHLSMTFPLGVARRRLLPGRQEHSSEATTRTSRAQPLF